MRLHIKDINDNDPRFPLSSHYLEVSESAEIGTSFVIPQATDLDSPENSIGGYELEKEQSHFKISPTKINFMENGDVEPYQLKLTLIKKLDREKESSFNFKVGRIFFTFN